MLSSGCDGVMIGRASFGCPEIFSILQGKEVTQTKLEIIKEHLSLLREDFEDSYIVKIIFFIMQTRLNDIVIIIAINIYI